MKVATQKVFEYSSKIFAIYVTFLAAGLIGNLFIDKADNYMGIFNIVILSLIAMEWSLKILKSKSCLKK